MNETQEHWLRMTDFGNFNGKGKLLLVFSIALFFAAVVYAATQDQVAAYDSRGGRRFFGFAFAIFAAGGFVASAILLESIGHSIYKPGRNPFKPGDFSISRENESWPKAAEDRDLESNDKSERIS